MWFPFLLVVEMSVPLQPIVLITPVGTATLVLSILVAAVASLVISAKMNAPLLVFGIAERVSVEIK